MKFFNKKVEEYSKINKIIGNIEQIPAESMAHRLVTADRLIFGNKVKFDIYSNQFIPLYEDATLWERMEKDGRYNDLLTGGGIVHFNLNSAVTPTQAKKIINFAVEKGSEHFALNSVYKKCENDHVSMGMSNSCPHCDGKIIEFYTRVIGFMTPVTSWNEVRRTFDFPNRKFTSITENEESLSVEGEMIKYLGEDKVEEKFSTNNTEEPRTEAEIILKMAQV